jgi:hypothetical protein
MPSEKILLIAAYGVRNVRCTRTLRINIPGSPVDRHYGKTAQTRGPSYHHGGPLNRVDALEADPANARRLLRPPHI